MIFVVFTNSSKKNPVCTVQVKLDLQECFQIRAGQAQYVKLFQRIVICVHFFRGYVESTLCCCIKKLNITSLMRMALQFFFTTYTLHLFYKT